MGGLENVDVWMGKCFLIIGFFKKPEEKKMNVMNLVDTFRFFVFFFNVIQKIFLY